MKTPSWIKPYGKIGWNISAVPEVQVWSRKIFEDGESDRSIVLVMGSLVETCLERALKHRLRKDAKLSNELFNFSGPLGTFSSKIKIAYMMGMISEIAYKDLITYKDIRNKFAHTIDMIDFDTLSISAKCSNFKLPEIFVREMSQEDKDAYEAHLRFGKPYNPEPLQWPVLCETGDISSLSYPGMRYVTMAQIFVHCFTERITMIGPHDEII
jgi:hypothetical protein